VNRSLFEQVLDAVLECKPEVAAQLLRKALDGDRVSNVRRGDTKTAVAVRDLVAIDRAVRAYHWRRDARDWPDFRELAPPSVQHLLKDAAE
jgi:hypothetical protein